MSETKKDEQIENNEKKKESESSKTKFTFKCTRCDKCCLSRGPIPITAWDLQLWAHNKVVANFLPYLDIQEIPSGGIDLILKPIVPPKSGNDDEASNTPSPFRQVPIEDLLGAKCSMYNEEQKKCLIYENRPLSCRTYPLEFDGNSFTIVDEECPGIGEEGMTKEDLKEMRDIAKTMFLELARMRISLPVLYQVLSKTFMMDLMKQQMEVMSNMSEEDRAKLDEIMKKNQDNEHEHEH
ncbi:MAG: YkgJ family cysteine cluster protein [Candidatus Lokiarchaeota archaeon]|nr:YkgJ family cysteine cluster protein [Candidatus Lokiarchaeota archaeon]